MRRDEAQRLSFEGKMASEQRWCDKAYDAIKNAAAYGFWDCSLRDPNKLLPKWVYEKLLTDGFTVSHDGWSWCIKWGSQ